MRAQFITAEEVQQILSVSRSKSYQIVRQSSGIKWTTKQKRAE